MRGLSAEERFLLTPATPRNVLRGDEPAFHSVMARGLVVLQRCEGGRELVTTELGALALRVDAAVGRAG